MEKFYIEKPSLERKNEIIEFLDEFVKYGSNINGVGSLNKIYDGYSIEQALDRCLKMENDEFAKSINRCPGKTFLLIRENDNRIVGSFNLRWNLNEALLNFGGNIGYSIRPTERQKGYNKINLYFALTEAKRIGLDKVMLSCNITNLGSDKTIKALSGILERCEVDPSDNELTNVYWINVNDSLNKYKDIYNQYIFSDNVKNII